MRDTAGEGAERVELLRMKQLALQLSLALLGRPRFGHVSNRPDPPDGIAVVVENRFDLCVNPFDRPVVTPKAVCQWGSLEALLGSSHRGFVSCAVVRMNERQELLLRRRRHLRIEPEYPVELLRPAHLSGPEIAVEAADLGEPLSAIQ